MDTALSGGAPGAWLRNPEQQLPGVAKHKNVAPKLYTRHPRLPEFI